MKGSKILVLMLAVLLVVTMFAGCSKPAPTGEPAATEPSGEKQIKIGLSLPTQREERWVRDKEKMEEVAAQMGVELIVKVADANTQEQITQVESLLTQGIDVLILAPHDASASATLVDKAKQEGIPVIAYDRLITNTDKLDVYMSFDNVKVGELQGKYITEQVPEGKYISLRLL